MSSDEDDGPGDEQESSEMKSERKRKREKKRRNDLAIAFSELESLLSRVDAAADAEAGRANTKRKRQGARDRREDPGGVTRLDLIGRAIEALRRIIRENEELKRALHQQGGTIPKTEKEVMVMVPTLTPVDDGRSAPRGGANYAHHYYAPQHSGLVQPVSHSFSQAPQQHDMSNYGHGGAGGGGGLSLGYYPAPQHHHSMPAYGQQQQPSWGPPPGSGGGGNNNGYSFAPTAVAYPHNNAPPHHGMTYRGQPTQSEVSSREAYDSHRRQSSEAAAPDDDD